MKKLLFSLVSLILFCTASAQNSVFNGDLNNDGKFSVADIVALNNIVVKKVLPKVIDGDFAIGSAETKVGTILFGDMDHDGKFTFEDIKLLAETFLEIKEEEPVTGDFEVREIVTAELVDGEVFNAAIKTLANGHKMAYNKNDSLIRNIVFDCRSDVSSGELVSTTNSQTPIYASFADGTITISTAADVITTKDMGSMFKGCSSLTTLDLSNFDTSKVTNMWCMFQGCSSLSSLDLSNFDTSNVTHMNSMFNDCSSLTSLALSNFDTSNVTDMNCMFVGCSSLSSLDLSSFDTSNVTNMNFMFCVCSSLTMLDLSNFDTSNVTDMNNMFNSCSSLTSLDLSSFDISNVEDMSSMCLCLASDVSSITIKCNVRTQAAMCENNTYLDQSKVVWSLVGATETTGTAELVDGMTFNAAIRTLANGHEMEFNEKDSVIQNIVFDCGSAVSSGVLISSEASEVPVYANFAEGTITISTAADVFTAKDMDYMFSRCSSLIALDLSNFDTSNVTGMGGMFSGCSSLTSLDLSNFDTSNVTNMGWMFDGCSSLNSLDLSSFDTSKVPYLSSMFGRCSSLTSLDLSSFDTSNMIDMSYTFFGCSSLTSLDLSNFNTSNVSNMGSMFFGCSSLTSLDLSNFNTSNVSNMGSMFFGCSSLTSLDLSNFDTSKAVWGVICMFYDCSSLTSLDLSNFDTSNMTNWGSMFSGVPESCILFVPKGCKDTYLSTDDQKKLRMVEMLASSGEENDHEYVDLGLPSGTLWATTNIGASQLEEYGLYFAWGETEGRSQDISDGYSYDWQSYKYCDGTENSMNKYCTHEEYGTVDMKTQLDPEDDAAHVNWQGKWKMPTITQIMELVNNCEWTSIEYKGVNGYLVTSKVNNNHIFLPKAGRRMDSSFKEYNDYAFYWSSTVSDAYCNLGRTLMAWDDSNYYYFGDRRTGHSIRPVMSSNPNAELVDGDTFTRTIKALANGHEMERYDQDTLIQSVEFVCGSSVSTGVLVSSENSGYPIYANFENGKMTISTAADVIYTGRDAGGYFMCFNALTSVDLSHLDTSHAMNMSGMFCHCWALESLDLSNFDTSLVGHMGSMFQNCSSLTSLDLSSFNTSNVIVMGNMFSDCRSLKELDLTNFDTRNVTNMENMFRKCSSTYPSSTLTVSCSDETKEAISLKGNMDMDRIIWKLQNTEQILNGKFINAITNSEMKQGESMANFLVNDAAYDPVEGYYTPEVIVGGGPNGMNCFKIVSKENPEYAWDTQLFIYTPDRKWVGGEQFRFHMWYKASREIGADSQIHTTPSNYKHWEVLNPNPQFTTEWQEMTWTGTFPTQGDGCQTIVFNLNKNVDDDPTAVIEYYFADIRWEYGVDDETEILPIAELVDGITFAKTIKETAYSDFSGGVDAFDHDHAIQSVEFVCGSSVSNGVLISSEYSSYPIYANFEDGKITISTAADVIYTGRNASNMFKHCQALTSVDLSHLDISRATDMSSMFSNCYALTSLDLSNFDTSNVTDMRWMCSDLGLSASSITIKCNEGTKATLCESDANLDQSKVVWDIVE